MRKQWSDIYYMLKEGRSLNEISRKLGLNKSTIYYHYRKIFDKKNKEINIKRAPDNKIGEFIGAFAGDGCYSKDKNYHHTVTFHFSSDEMNYVNSFKNLLQNIFGKEPCIYKQGNKIVIQYRSKKMIEFIRKYLRWIGKRTKTVALCGGINRYSNEFLIGFLRGNLDTDGYVSKRKVVTFSTASEKLNKQIKNILDKLNIKYSEYIDTYVNNKKRIKTGGSWGPQYRIDIKGIDGTRLLQKIEPHNPKRIRK